MKGYNGPSILCAVLLFGAVLVSPAFADKKAFEDKKKIDDAELSQMNASVTGASDKDWNAGAVSAGGTIDKTSLFLSQPDSNAGNGFSLNVPLGAETTYYWHPWANNGTNQLYWGGGTTTTYIRSR